MVYLSFLTIMTERFLEKKPHIFMFFFFLLAYIELFLFKVTKMAS